MSSQPCERHRWSRPSPTCLSLLLLVTMATGGPCPQVSNPNCRCLTSSSSTSTPPDVTCIFSSPHPHQPPIFADSPAIKLALGTLDLSHNALESLPPDFLQGIQTVERLSLRNNCLTHIPPVLRGLGGVTSLDLSYNCLTGLPLTTGAALSGLEILDLSGNKMEVLLADRHQETTTTRDLQFKSLRLLNLSCNAIQRIEGRVFSPMRHLVTLDLSRNRLREVTDAMFSWLTLSLSCLDLSHNLLRHLQPSSLRHLQHLRALSLAHNDNLWVEGVRFPAHMRSVDLSHCALTFLDHCQLTALPDLAFIGLRGNHLHCTCQLYLLLQWYQEQHHKSGRTMDADHTGTNWTCTTASTTTTTSIIGEMGDQREEVGRVQYVHDLWQCQDTESHCQTLEHTLHHLTGQSQVGTHLGVWGCGGDSGEGQMSVTLDVMSSGTTVHSDMCCKCQ
ncbi:podocan-like protein 1 [Babylonia areolata]|uniref:podocan-like protein 1 n=1 Tax=Babylonia areolata TaxID=304850 RepID=UPI003FCF93EE